MSLLKQLAPISGFGRFTDTELEDMAQEAANHVQGVLSGIEAISNMMAAAQEDESGGWFDAHAAQQVAFFLAEQADSAQTALQLRNDAEYTLAERRRGKA